MKIAISAQGSELDAAVDPRFGRAAYFLIVDTETSACQAIDNATNVSASGGAGTRSAENVVQAGAKWVLSGDVGPKARRALEAAEVGITVGVQGTCREAVEAFKANAGGA